MDDYYTKLISWIRKTPRTKEAIGKKKLELCKALGFSHIPTDIEVLLHANKEDLLLLKALQTKPTRSLSGVAVIAIMSKPRSCPHGKCAMCPGGPGSGFGDVPQSYTGKEPATRRAIRNSYDPCRQVWNRLEQYVVTGHVPDKIELIVMGGTFPAAPWSYQKRFIAKTFMAMNRFSAMFIRDGTIDIRSFRDFFMLPGDINDPRREKEIARRIRRAIGTVVPILVKEQKLNEVSGIRCVGLTLETRPDKDMARQADRMLMLGCTRVELGVQSVYDDALSRIKRGHTVADSITATKDLKDRGFKVSYHMMPGLPGVGRKKDIIGLRKIFDDSNFRPDMLKIYPCMVLPGTELHDDWADGSYIPLSTGSAAGIIAEFKRHVPEYVRIMRVQRDIPSSMVSAGVDRTNLRQYVSRLMEEKGISCRCIRCREAGRNDASASDYAICKRSYDSSGGTEVFISAESGDSVLGFVRLRIPGSFPRKEITKSSAIIRELHVYGAASALGRKGPIQHRGIGKRLLREAENEAVSSGKREVIVIAGVGAREYYRRLGYRKKGPYMVRKVRS